MPADAPETLPLVRGVWQSQSAPPTLVQGPVPEGHWGLEAFEFYVTNSVTPIGNIDLKTSYVLARGQVYTQVGELAYDLANDIVVLSDSGTRFGQPSKNTFRGPFAGGSSHAQFQATCPEGGTPVKPDWGVDGDALTIGFESSAVPGRTLWPR